jgi:hypothetical protein
MRGLANRPAHPFYFSRGLMMDARLQMSEMKGKDRSSIHGILKERTIWLNYIMLYLMLYLGTDSSPGAQNDNQGDG